MVEIDTIAYNGWDHCIDMRNDYIKLIATTDVGPRIIWFGSSNDDVNMFHQWEEQQGLTGSKEWLNYGGHRLWHAPQIGDRPNQPDNEKVLYKIHNDTIELFCPEEMATRVRKEILIVMSADQPTLTVCHRIYNNNPWSISLASWALSVMHDSGVVILPIPEDDTHYMPNYMISFWPWTRPNDYRFTLGEKYMLLRHDPNEHQWFKIGYRNTAGWGAYLFGGYMFVKKYHIIPGAEYPDFGASFETFADSDMVELETLSPLKTIDTGEYVEHTEEWRLVSNIKVPESEKEIDDNIVPLCVC